MTVWNDAVRAALPKLRLISLALLLASERLPAATYGPSRVTPPKPEREFRGAWIATVGNIDWPSRRNLTSNEQKAELAGLLDQAVKLRLNAVIFQVRPACDAVYQSSLEPWSEFLTGRMGQAPEPAYDPLAWVIEEAHRRGLELHAWFNPFRAGHPSGRSEVSANHITRAHPELVRHYGKQVWLDPGEPAVHDHSLAVVMDVVRRYDVDGIHFDDYFYPYKETNSAGAEMDFPDESSWKRFGASGRLGRDDWRRENVNRYIHRTYDSIKLAKPWVKFGVSPFGIWRPGEPASIKGFDAYDKIFADSKKWLTQGWLDYVTPQLYWAIDARDQSFPVLLEWWERQNRNHRHLWPGLDSTKTTGRNGTKAKWPASEIVEQIRLTRKEKGVDGHIHWNMHSLATAGPLDDALLGEVYREPALIPASPWLGGTKPGRPSLTAENANGGGVKVSWGADQNSKAAFWVFQKQTNGKWQTEILPGATDRRAVSQRQPEVIAVTAVDRTGNLSAASVVELKR